MVGNNEIPQLMKMVEKMQIRLDVSEKKMELLAITLETFIKNAPKRRVRNLVPKEGKMVRRRKK